MFEQQAFDPGNSMDATSETFRRGVTELALAAYKITLYRELGTEEQLQCWIAGALTGFVGVCLASVDSAGADAMMEHIAECLPSCREMAESIKAPDGSTLKNHHDACERT